MRKTNATLKVLLAGWGFFITACSSWYGFDDSLVISIPRADGGYHRVRASTSLSASVRDELALANQKRGFIGGDGYRYQPINAEALLDGKSFVISEGSILLVPSTEQPCWKLVDSEAVAFVARAVVASFASDSDRRETFEKMLSEWR